LTYESYQNESREKWESFISERWFDKDERAYWEAVKGYAYDHVQKVRNVPSGKGLDPTNSILMSEDWRDGDVEAFWAAAKRNGYEMTQAPVEVPLVKGYLHSILVLISGRRSDEDDAFWDEARRFGCVTAQKCITIPLEKGCRFSNIISDASYPKSRIFGRPLGLGAFLGWQKHRAVRKTRKDW
jgi:hypothetical protein